MSVKITVRIEDHIAEKIVKSGMNTSDYTRRALELYSVNKDNSIAYTKLQVIDDCIDLLREHKDELQSSMVSDAYTAFKQDVRQNDENCLTKLSDKNEKTVGLSDKKEETVGQVVGQNTVEMSDIFEETVRQMKDDYLYTTYKPYLELLSKMLNLHNSVPDYTKKKITDETHTKPAELNKFLFHFREEIKQIQWSISSETSTIEYDDGK